MKFTAITSGMLSFDLLIPNHGFILKVFQNLF